MMRSSGWLCILYACSWMLYAHGWHGRGGLHTLARRSRATQVVLMAQASRDSPFIMPGDCQSLSAEELQSLISTTSKGPLLLRNVFPLVGDQNEQLTEQLMERLASEPVQYDIRTLQSDDEEEDSDDEEEQDVDEEEQRFLIETFECSLQELIETLTEDEGRHDENIYMMTETLLEKHPDLMEPYVLPKDKFGVNLFDQFPALIKPKSALIVGSRGARSFLHSDPYDWLGWNYLLEGKKLWVFFPSAVPPGDLLADYHAPEAWNMDTYQIATGFVSQVDYFRSKLPVRLAEERPNEKAKLGNLNKFLSKHFHELISQQSTTLTAAEKERLFKRYGKLPFFRSEDSSIDFAEVNSALVQGVKLVVQNEGECVFIPPGMWHQVYHLKPSVAIASQHMADANKNTVFQHIINWCAKCGLDLDDEIEEEENGEDKATVAKDVAVNGDDVLSAASQEKLAGDLVQQAKEIMNSKSFQTLQNNDQIKEVIRLGLSINYGDAEGEQLFSQLYPPK